jgi:hypothetical protein
MQPVEDANRGWIGLFIFFMLFGSFFVTNLFIGVVVDTFNSMKEQLGDDFLLSGTADARRGSDGAACTCVCRACACPPLARHLEEKRMGFRLLPCHPWATRAAWGGTAAVFARADNQKEWVRTQEELLSMQVSSKLRPPSNWLRRRAFMLFKHPQFDSYIMLAIVGNLVRMAPCVHQLGCAALFALVCRVWGTARAWLNDDVVSGCAAVRGVAMSSCCCGAVALLRACVRACAHALCVYECAVCRVCWRLLALVCPTLPRFCWSR